jgi:D-beta-D-heptose 7-phosphate kinase/D-beta-D-heptose 1-phosphate adenosyltransferase
MLMVEPKIIPRSDAARLARWLQASGRKIVFSNGCFDILHIGHVYLLEQARRLGDALIVGLNTDASVRRLKGPGRPVNPERERAIILAALGTVDYVVCFDEDTPLELIGEIQPDVLVKGGDYQRHEIVGAELVMARGGEVVTFPLVPGISTSVLLHRLQRKASPKYLDNEPDKP